MQLTIQPKLRFHAGGVGSPTPVLDPPPRPVPRSDSRWPHSVEMILSALDVGHGPASTDKRRLGRRRYRVRALLRLHSDAQGAPPWTIYTRDSNARGLGFITPHLLPLGYGGVIQIQTPDGRPAEIACTLLRCKEIAKGWYDGSLYFHRERGGFDVG